jgi:hypothetical protein
MKGCLQSDSDYGRTNVVKHNIAKGFAHPIKQPLRRLPYVLAKEVDKQVKGMLNNEVITPYSSPVENQQLPDK